MATATNTSQQQPAPAVGGPVTEETTAKAIHKRYEGLMMVRTKAIKGKGAWYWAHLEPILVHSPETGLPKAVKLRCSLCDAVFSASNPSRTASEHLKRGTCPNFNTSSSAKPISSISPNSSPGFAPPHTRFHHGGGGGGGGNRKRSTSSSSAAAASPSYNVTPLTIVDPARFPGGEYHHHHQPHHHHNQPHLMLSGGKDDLGALAMLEDSVKKLKSPKTPQMPALSKSQIESSLDSLADWVFESCGSVSISGLEHPKFRAFLNQVGLPTISKREFTGSRLDAKFEEMRTETEARIQDAMFFQIASNGWKVNNFDENLVNLTVNLPNGTSLYRRALFINGSVPSNYAEEILWETMKGVCGNSVQKCVGIVSDRFKNKDLKNLENQHQWMVNLSCQYQGFNSLIKDFSKDLPLFKSVVENCFRLAGFINDTAQIRNIFCKYQLQEFGYVSMLRLPTIRYCHENASHVEPVYSLLDDVLNSARSIRLVMHSDACNVVPMEETVVKEIQEMVEDIAFWNEVEAVHSLIKLVKEMAREIEEERPLVGQCLPLWDELRSKIKEWCSKFHVADGNVEKIIERRFKKNYHPAWAAAFTLDPLYLIRDTSGKYLPPFKCLSLEQEKDVDKLITRLVSREEAHIALMELMKWRTEGLDPVYARAVQMKQRDPITGKMKIANPQSSRLVWETYLSEFKSLGKVAVRIIFLSATSCGFKCNSSLLRWVGSHGRSRAAMDKAQKLICLSANSKFERRDFSSDEGKDAELLASANDEDDVLNDVLVDTSSV